jgi:hypothetical protein
MDTYELESIKNKITIVAFLRAVVVTNLWWLIIIFPIKDPLTYIAVYIFIIVTTIVVVGYVVKALHDIWVRG